MTVGVGVIHIRFTHRNDTVPHHRLAKAEHDPGGQPLIDILPRKNLIGRIGREEIGPLLEPAVIDCRDVAGLQVLQFQLQQKLFHCSQNPINR